MTTDCAMQAGLKTEQDGKGLLQVHLWCQMTFQGYGIEQNISSVGMVITFFRVLVLPVC